MGLLLLVVVWMALAMWGFVGLCRSFEWFAHRPPRLFTYALLTALALAPGVVVVHSVAVLPFFVAIAYQPPGSETFPWNLGSWALVGVGSFLSAVVVRTREERSARGDAP